MDRPGVALAYVVQHYTTPQRSVIRYCTILVRSVKEHHNVVALMRAVVLHIQAVGESGGLQVESALLQQSKRLQFFCALDTGVLLESVALRFPMIRQDIEKLVPELRVCQLFVRLDGTVDEVQVVEHRDLPPVLHVGDGLLEARPRRQLAQALYNVPE